MTTDYTDLIAALHLPIHGAQQEWTCRKAAHALAALTIERDASNKLAVQAFAKAEALAGEVERLRGVAALVGDVQNRINAQHLEIGNLKSERDRLKAVLKPRLNAKAIEGLQEILEAMEAMDEREAPFLKTLLDWHEAAGKALGDAS